MMAPSHHPAIPPRGNERGVLLLDFCYNYQMGTMSGLSSTPELLLIGGPNGAGKTTFVNTFLPEYTNVREFVNADLIAKGISPFEPEGALIEAGKVLLNRVHQLIGENISFALESTLSGKSYAALLHSAKERGYSVKLYFI